MRQGGALGKVNKVWGSRRDTKDTSDSMIALISDPV